MLNCGSPEIRMFAKWHLLGVLSPLRNKQDAVHEAIYTNAVVVGLTPQLYAIAGSLISKRPISDLSC